ncbi:PadR family transcriptional regulator [Yonghaparkia sp. Root332]|uniref:PadR family transcriptional regulator n=1 Tax=Yonghaparkia sp. Root332 TaxID=1736516 RepID=UPI0006FCE39F|nr:PadR family transcriptional regulator [Yonghaparkia sp. Root332]KQV24448.1 transcriptional regulator [Yonghaparkia sp. Root332]
MSVRHGLLALLSQGPSYGYQLKVEFERRTGDSWPVNVGQVYNTLDRLERDGLIERGETDGDGHVFYAITDAGAAEARSWLEGPVVRGAAARDELAVKLALAVTLPDVDPEAIIHAQRVATIRSLQELTRSKAAGGDPDSPEEFAWQLVVDALIFQAEAEVRWLEHSEARIRRLRARTGSEGAARGATASAPRTAPAELPATTTASAR